ncbi:MAG TPA: TetR/AcrR family transcriptional regulator [Marmoricola sp.]|jgi:AcrR family transcriptional regulator|nr:TetR/AcrR family transcriptional regulator [Marmoricola sp.]
MGGPERSYGGKTASERAAERRARLVEATIEVLSEHGEAHATMTAICAGAGLTERYFYESFGGLDDALLAALDSVCEEILGLASTVVQSTGGTPEARVHAVMVAFVGLVTEAPAKARVAVIHASANPRLRARRNELLSVFADFVAREAAGLYGEDAWPAARARIHGLVYIAGFSELVASWLSGDVELTEAELVETAEGLFAALSRRS